MRVLAISTEKRGKYQMAVRIVVWGLILGATSAVAQDGSLLQQKLTQMGEATKNNQLQLRGYEWQESVAVTVDGHQPAPRQSLCRYAADGSVLKTPLGSTDSNVKHGGPLRSHMMKEKQEEVAEVGKAAGQYLPPDPNRLRDAVAAGRAALESDGQGATTVVFHDYQRPGDEMKLILDPASMQVTRIEISTYLDSGRSPVLEQIRFARLADGTLYPAQTAIQAPEKKVLISITNTNYVRLAP